MVWGEMLLKIDFGCTTVCSCSSIGTQNLKSNSPPDPHPLDFDWRFTSATVEEIRALLSNNVSTIAVGAPSIARRLEQIGQDVLLIDRQPFQGVSNHIKAEIGGVLPSVGPFAQAVVDPPWYPNELHDWVAWTANLLGEAGVIFVLIWPDDVRPQGRSEALNFVRWAKDWADVEPLPTVPLYQEPPFEHRAAKFSSVPVLSVSPRQGRLLRLTIKRVPELGVQGSESSKEKWVRFVLNDYQLALKLDAEGDAPLPLSVHPEAVGWHWPYVSRRAPKRNLIGLWSSNNEVALTQSPVELLEALRTAFTQTSAKGFEESLGKFAVLNQWSIPRPPYKRSIEWQHL